MKRRPLEFLIYNLKDLGEKAGQSRGESGTGPRGESGTGPIVKLGEKAGRVRGRKRDGSDC